MKNEMLNESASVKSRLLDESPDIGFEPIEAVEEAGGFEASLEPVEFHAVGLKREVEMDGKLGDEAWKTAPLIPEMRSRAKGELLGPPTEVRLLYSPTALYVGAVMHEPDMEHLVAQFDQNDLAIYSDDCLEMIIDPSGRPGQFFHVVINALCSIYDSRDGKKNWNGKGFAAKSARFEDRWTVELKMPYEAFDNMAAPEPGEFWGIRFCRERHHDQASVAVPFLKGGSLSARQYLGKMIFDPSAASELELNREATSFSVGMNIIPVEIKTKEAANLKLRARIYDSDNNILDEVSREFTAPAKVDFKLPIKTDAAMRAVITVLGENGDAIDSFVLTRDFAFVAPGFEKLDKELRLLQGGCEDILDIEHPVYRGAKKSIERMRAAIAEYKQLIAKAIEDGTTVDKKLTDDFAALENGFREFRNKYSYLVWQTSPWEVGSPSALPPVDYSTELSLSFKQASNERERVALVFSGLLLNRRLDLRIMPYSIDEGETFIPYDRFEIYMEPYTDHNGTLNTNPLVKIEGNIITLTPGEAVRVHIVFNSKDVETGKYETKLKFKPLYDYSVANRDIPVKMEVWNFRLPETRDWPVDCFLWGPNRYDNDEAAMLRLMHSRHINYGWTESIRYSHGFKGMRRVNSLPEGSEKFDMDKVLHENEEFFKTAKELGMKFVFGWGTPDSIEWHHIMDKRLLDMGFTREDFIFKSFLRDEFKKAQIPLFADMRKEIHEANPEWKFQGVYLSSPPPSGATLEDIEEAHLTDTHKNWTLITGLLRDEDKSKEIMKYFRDRDCTVWAYECATTMHTQPVLEYYRLFPWFGYQKKTDGVAIWTNLAMGGEDGFDFREGYNDGATVLDSTRKPIPTKRFEAVSKGLEDVAYMYELQSQLERLEGKLSEAEMSEYKALIGDKLSEISKSGSQELVDEWHYTVGALIDRLSRM